MTGERDLRIVPDEDTAEPVEPENDDDFDADFDADFDEPSPLVALLEHLVVGTRRDLILDQLHLTEEALDALIPQAVAAGGGAWVGLTASQARRLAFESLDAVDRRVYRVLHEGTYLNVELAGVLIDTLRFRAELAGVVVPAAGGRR